MDSKFQTYEKVGAQIRSFWSHIKHETFISLTVKSLVDMDFFHCHWCQVVEDLDRRHTRPTKDPKRMDSSQSDGMDGHQSKATNSPNSLTIEVCACNQTTTRRIQTRRIVVEPYEGVVVRIHSSRGAAAAAERRRRTAPRQATFATARVCFTRSCWHCHHYAITSLSS